MNAVFDVLGRLAGAWRPTLAVACALLALEALLGVGWLRTWLPDVLSSPGFYPRLFLGPVLRGLCLLWLARRLLGLPAPEPDRILGVAWSEIVIRVIPGLTALYLLGIGGVGEFNAWHVILLAGTWCLGSGLPTGLFPLVRAGLWGAYATATPARHVVGQVAFPAGVDGSMLITGPTLLSMMLRCTAAMLRPQLFAEPAHPEPYAAAFTVAAVALDLFVVAASVVLWPPSPVEPSNAEPRTDDRPK